MKAQGLVNFYNISHCMFRNKLNDGRVVPVTHACNALHESMRTYCTRSQNPHYLNDYKLKSQTYFKK